MHWMALARTEMGWPAETGLLLAAGRAAIALQRGSSLGNRVDARAVWMMSFLTSLAPSAESKLLIETPRPRLMGDKPSGAAPELDRRGLKAALPSIAGNRGHGRRRPRRASEPDAQERLTAWRRLSESVSLAALAAGACRRCDALRRPRLTQDRSSSNSPATAYRCHAGNSAHYGVQRGDQKRRAYMRMLVAAAGMMAITRPPRARGPRSHCRETLNRLCTERKRERTHRK